MEGCQVASCDWFNFSKHFIGGWIFLCGPMVGCHVAQSWASTWHPGGQNNLAKAEIPSTRFERTTLRLVAHDLVARLQVLLTNT